MTPRRAGRRPPTSSCQRRPVRRVSRVAGSRRCPPTARSRSTVRLHAERLRARAGHGRPDDVSTIRFLPFGRKPGAGHGRDRQLLPAQRRAAPVRPTSTSAASCARSSRRWRASSPLLYAAARRSPTNRASWRRRAASRWTASSRCSGYAATAPGAQSARCASGAGGAPATITIPAGTPITDSEDKMRYETTETQRCWRARRPPRCACAAPRRHPGREPGV